VAAKAIGYEREFRILRFHAVNAFEIVKDVSRPSRTNARIRPNLTVQKMMAAVRKQAITAVIQGIFLRNGDLPANRGVVRVVGRFASVVGKVHRDSSTITSSPASVVDFFP
jgi:hypothetical protein